MLVICNKKKHLNYTSRFNYWLAIHIIFIAHLKLHVKVLNVSASTQDWTDAGLGSQTQLKHHMLTIYLKPQTELKQSGTCTWEWVINLGVL